MDNYNTDYIWQDAQGELLFQPHYDFGTISPSIEFPQCGINNYSTPPSRPLTTPYSRPESVSSLSTASQRSPIIEPDAPFASDSVQVKWSGNDKRQRRREQNRFAQRAYRERREQYQMQLEKQLVEMRKKHELLSRSHSEQQDHIQQLRALIDDLSARKNAFEKDPGYPLSPSGYGQEPAAFDMYTCACANGQSVG